MTDSSECLLINLCNTWHADTHGQAVEVSCLWSQGHQVHPCGLQDEESLSEVSTASSESVRASNSAYRCSPLVWVLTPFNKLFSLFLSVMQQFSVWERSGLKRKTGVAEMMELSVSAMDIMQILLTRRDQFNNWGKLNAVDLNSLTHSFSLIVN